MRRAAKIDKNQNEIVKAFRDLGASVLILSGVGQGCPDTCIGFGGVNVLVELKTPKGALTPDQVVFFDGWRGDAQIARSIDDAIQIIQSIKKGGGNVNH